MFSTPGNYTSSEFLELEGKKESYFLSKNCVLRKCCWSTLEMVNARAFKLFAIMLSNHENLLVGISGALGMKEAYFLSKHCVMRKCCGVFSEKVSARALNPLPLCSAPLKAYFCRDFWSSRNEKKTTF